MLTGLGRPERILCEPNHIGGKVFENCRTVSPGPDWFRSKVRITHVPASPHVPSAESRSTSRNRGVVAVAPGRYLRGSIPIRPAAGSLRRPCRGSVPGPTGATGVAAPQPIGFPNSPLIPAGTIVAVPESPSGRSQSEFTPQRVEAWDAGHARPRAIWLPRA